MEVVGDVIKSVDVVDVNSERTVYILGQLDLNYFLTFKNSIPSWLVWSGLGRCTVPIVLAK